jgi:dienelactone hydrolase
VYAYVGLPAGASSSSPVPGVVLVHGGGGTAFSDWVELWTNRGYAAISIAVEGQTDSRAPPTMNTGWHIHDKPGPVRVGIYGDTDVEPITDQWMYHAVADTVLANSLLRSLPEVTAADVGVMGISWGGVITSTAIGIDDRFRFAIPTYGCGNKDIAENIYGDNLGNNDLYKNVWDPMVRITNATMPVLWYSWPKEWHFPLYCQRDTYTAAPGEHMVSLVPGMGHGHGAAWNRPESYAYADSIISNGTGWCVQQGVGLSNGLAEAVFQSSRVLDSSTLIYTLDAGLTGDRVWNEIPAALVDNGGGSYTVAEALPQYASAWFLNVRSGSLISSSDFQETGVVPSNIVYNTTTNWSAQTVRGNDLVTINSGAAVTLDAPAGAASNLVVNGSFETPDATPDADPGPPHGFASHAAGGGTLSGWTVSSNTVFVIDGFDNFDADLSATASDGDQFVQLQFNSSASMISQTISTEAGQTYRLEFDYGGIYFAAKDVTLTYTVGGSARTLNYSLVDLATGQVAWESEAVEFTATEAATTLSFTGDFNSGFWGPGIDNVRVTEVSGARAAGITVNDDDSPASSLLINQDTTLSIGGGVGLVLGAGTGAGIVNQSTGTVTTTSLTVNSGGTGSLSQYNLSGGSLAAGAVAVNHAGELNLSGGELALLGDGGTLDISNGGVVDIHGGILSKNLLAPATNNLSIGMNGQAEGLLRVQSGGLQVVNGLVYGVINLYSKMDISGGDVDLEAQVRVWNEFKVSGDEASINFGWMGTFAGSDLVFELDDTGVSTINVGAWMSLQNTAISVDGSAYNGGAGSLLLLDALNLAGVADTGNIAVAGFTEQGLDAEVVQDQAADEVRLVLTENEYGAWASARGLSGADARMSADPDGNGRDNLMEFATGTGFPAFEVPGGTNGMEVVYHRRTGGDLVYTLEGSSNLVSGAWSTDGISETGVGSVDADYEAVTNALPSEDAGFARLSVESP